MKLSHVWKQYIFYYLILLPIGAAFIFMIDRFFNYSEGSYIFVQLWFVLLLITIVMFVNPIIAGYLVKRKFKDIAVKTLAVPVITVYLMTILFFSTPYIVLTINTYINAKSDKETVSSLIENARNEKRFNVKLIRYYSQNDFLEPTWLDLTIVVKVELPAGYDLWELKEFFRNVKFNRNSVIEAYASESTKANSNADTFFLIYFYDAETKELTSR